MHPLKGWGGGRKKKKKEKEHGCVDVLASKN